MFSEFMRNKNCTFRNSERVKNVNKDEKNYVTNYEKYAFLFF